MNSRNLHILTGAVCLLVLVACSNQKNTSGTRFYHAMTARFNTFYNGYEAYKTGVEEQEKAHVDDYGSLLPIYISRDKKTQGTGEGSFETAITKCEKAIKQHSIKKRPAVNVNKKKTAKDKAYLARKEFNPFLKNAWLLMGQAQFRQGKFIEAASTFHYITQIYATQPEVLCVAMAWLARCYVQLDWPYDAENIFSKLKTDSITSEGLVARNASYADYLILTKQYQDAIPYLEKTIRKEKSKKQKARLNYLLGQLFQITDKPEQAYRALRQVIRSNPPYELELSARVKQSEVVPRNQYQQMIKKLNRMAKSDKNKDYLDQVYYALGNIYLAMKDTAHCIGAYEKGVAKSTRNGTAKAQVLMHLAQLYWEKEEYVDAQRCYADLISILDKEHEAYPEMEKRSKILDELSPHIAAVELQDSLQELARMPEKERNRIIDRIIEELKKKEKEEAKAQHAASGNTAGGQAAANGKPAGGTPTAPGMGGFGGQKGAWYFYNPMVVQQGKIQFQRTWGKRPLEDNWRRSDKRTVNNQEFEEYNYDEEEEQQSSDSTDTEIADEEALLNDSAANDPHQREYYLKQIPFTQEQMDASNLLLSEGLYQSGILEMEKLHNYPLAHRTLLRLMTDFPDFAQKDMAYYYLFLLYRRMNQPEEAEGYRQKLISEYPDNEYAQTLANPHYEEYARRGRLIEDSLYAATYQAYEANSYEQVMQNFEREKEDFPKGAHFSKFLFLKAMSELYTGKREDFLKSLKELVQKYPQEEITGMASHIIKGIEEGRPLNDSKFDASSIWERRSMVLDKDSAQLADTLSAERYTDFVFLLAYPKHSLNEDLMLYQLARYNFTSFLVRNFDIEVKEDPEIHQMLVKGFRSYDEVHAYAQKIMGDATMAPLLKKTRMLLISEENLKLLGRAFSFADYEDFYEKTFVPMDIKKDVLLDEPTEIRIRTEEEQNAAEEEEQNSKYDSDEYGYDY